MKQPLISVLIPVYNVEKTLDRCIQSVLRQTFQDFEIILIDDGSTDGSGAICDEYEKKYSNISVIHKANEGLGPTRNCGIFASKGEFIYHCDSDDCLKENLLEKAYNTIERTNAEMVVFGYELFTEENGILKTFSKVGLNGQLLENKKDIQKLFVENYFNSFVMMSAWNRLQRRSFIMENNLFFPDLRRCQDMAYSFLIFDKLQKLAIIDDPLYCYMIEPGVFKGRSFVEMIEIYKSIFETSKSRFQSWDLLNQENNQKLINNVCEQIANYASYAFAVKYKDAWKENATLLIKDKQVRKLYKKYKNQRHSKFMRLFTFGIILRCKKLLMLLSQKKQRMNRG